MNFAEYFKISIDKKDDWFNPILHQDTQLFIDPFLVFKSTDTLFKDSYPQIMDFFNIVFRLIAQSGGNENHSDFKKAVNLLTFHEVNEICLGYSPDRTGAGPGKGLAKSMALNIAECIGHGITNIRHFEEIGLFHPRIGQDLISDMTANLIKDRLVTYTQNICEKKGIEMSLTLLPHFSFDHQYLRWERKNVLLPQNPFKKAGILLLPKRFLNYIPEINKKNFWDNASDNISDNEALRNDLNYEIGKNIDKETIAKIARENYGSKTGRAIRH